MIYHYMGGFNSWPLPTLNFFLNYLIGIYIKLIKSHSKKEKFKVNYYTQKNNNPKWHKEEEGQNNIKIYIYISTKFSPK